MFHLQIWTSPDRDFSNWGNSVMAFSENICKYQAVLIYQTSCLIKIARILFTDALLDSNILKDSNQMKSMWTVETAK